MSCQQTMTLGVYLLGALDPGERFSFESHLSYCEICRGELIRLAPLPGLLNQITPDDFADNMPPTDVEFADGVIATRAQPVIAHAPVARQLPPVADEEPEPKNRPRNKPRGGPKSKTTRRRFWRAMSSVAAVVVIAVGAVFGWQALRHEPPQADEGVVWTGSSPDGSAWIEARLVERDWGTEIQSEIHGLPPNRECYLIVYDHYGYREIAGWWGTDHDPNLAIPASTSIQRGTIERLEFRLDDKSLALAIEAPR
ncbi:zf-HC2 domain-containing protein [Actinophytocola sp.]|uniref:zf-HC2 domain-containing protein n=1 Tax=Actinophytocola sp. TaxID=1872138 RepID=UPI002ECFF32C